MNAIPFLADFNRMEAMRRAFDGSRGYLSDSDVNLVTALVVVLAVALALFLAVRLLRRSTWIRRNPYLLFLELCWAHRLSIRETLLLLRLGRQRYKKNPAFVFLEPDAFTHAALGEACEARLEGLYHRLF